jgi:hypothetical protein
VLDWKPRTTVADGVAPITGRSRSYLADWAALTCTATSLLDP